MRTGRVLLLRTESPRRSHGSFSPKPVWNRCNHGVVNTRKASRVLVAIPFGLALAVALSTVPASAQNAKVEAAAKALQKKAIEEDYLATDFAKAQDKLEKANASCGGDKCSPALRAQLLRDLGVVQIGGQLDKEKGISNFVEALKLDPAIALEADLRTNELDAAFAEAKKRAGGGASGAAKPAASTGGQPTGDFIHDPVPGQQIRTSIPVYAEYSGEESLVKVIVRYKGFGMSDWKPVELKKSGDKGWAGLLPCGDMQQGVAQYYIQGFNAENDPVAVGGDRHTPYKVKVTTEKVAEPPHLPGQPPPTQCADTGDCPPNFPGCKTPTAGEASEPTGKDGGEFCEEDTECKSNECKASKCTEPKHEASSQYRKLWIGASVGFELLQFVPTSNDVCKLTPPSDANPLIPTNTENYYCVASDGSDYPFRTTKADVDANHPRANENANLVQGVSDKVAGGGAFGSVRMLLSADYALNMNLLLGIRLGYVLNTYPGQAAKDDAKAFPPIHAELRGTYLIGQDALTKTFAPYAMLGAGVAPFDAKVKVSVVEQPPGGVKAQKDVDAWHLAGPAFAMFGGGVRIGMGSRAALMGGLRVNFAFGNSFAPSLGPELGVMFGF